MVPLEELIAVQPLPSPEGLEVVTFQIWYNQVDITMCALYKILLCVLSTRYYYVCSLQDITMCTLYKILLCVLSTR